MGADAPIPLKDSTATPEGRPGSGSTPEMYCYDGVIPDSTYPLEMTKRLFFFYFFFYFRVIPDFPPQS
jgi:hypothetical protein